MTSDYEHIRTASAKWIRAASEIALAKMGSTTTRRKADRSPVTEADLAVQDAILQSIARRYPEDAVITEETQSRPDAHPAITGARRCWVVDPIDGTRNYARSLPVFTVSVALMEEGRPVVGWIYDPVGRRMYSASADGGAWVNDERVMREDQRETSPDNVFISIPTSRHEELPAVVHEWIDRMTVRNLGSTALHLALLGTGAMDAVYCRKSKLWDIAAGALFARQTGAELVSYVTGRPWFPMDLTTYDNGPMPFIAARPGVLGHLLEEYRRSNDGEA